MLQYTFMQLTVYYELLYNGEVFTTTDNSETLDSYSVSNLGVEYTLQNNTVPILIGLKINNIFDTYYENVAFRPMPTRNYQIFLNFKF